MSLLIKPVVTMTETRRRPTLAPTGSGLDGIKRLVFAVVGCGLMVGAVAWGLDKRRFVARAARAPGVVVRLNAGGAHPEIRFVAADGRPVEYPQGGMIWGYRAGDAVTVLYDPASPVNSAVIDRLGALWGFTVMNFLMGVVFVLIAWFARA